MIDLMTDPEPSGEPSGNAIEDEDDIEVDIDIGTPRLGPPPPGPLQPEGGNLPQLSIVSGGVTEVR